MNKFEQKWTSLSKNEHVWAKMHMFEQKWTSFSKNDHVFEQKWTSLSQNEHVWAKWTCLSKNEHVWAKINKFEQKWINMSKNKQVQARLYNFRREWACLSKNELVSAERNVSEQKWTSFSWLKKHKTILNFLFAFLNLYGLNLKVFVTQQPLTFQDNRISKTSNYLKTFYLHIKKFWKLSLNLNLFKYRVTGRLEKKLPNFSKNSLKSCHVKKGQNIYNKAQF